MNEQLNKARQAYLTAAANEAALVRQLEEARKNTSAKGEVLRALETASADLAKAAEETNND